MNTSKSTGKKIEEILEVYRKKYPEVRVKNLKVRYVSSSPEPWEVTVEDESNPWDYGESEGWCSHSFDLAVDYLYRQLVLNELVSDLEDEERGLAQTAT